MVVPGKASLFDVALQGICSLTAGLFVQACSPAGPDGNRESVSHLAHVLKVLAVYPRGLAGNDIPISARLMAVADVYDALISPRVYKSAYSHDQSIQMMVAARGTHFDPDIVDAMVTVAEEFRAIANEYVDGLVA
jgi:hypothetical protein